MTKSVNGMPVGSKPPARSTRAKAPAKPRAKPGPKPKAVNAGNGTMALDLGWLFARRQFTVTGGPYDGYTPTKNSFGVYVREERVPSSGVEVHLPIQDLACQLTARQCGRPYRIRLRRPSEEGRLRRLHGWVWPHRAVSRSARQGSRCFAPDRLRPQSLSCACCRDRCTRQVHRRFQRPISPLVAVQAVLAAVVAGLGCVKALLQLIAHFRCSRRPIG